MVYREHTPHPLLARFVRCIWTLSGRGATPGSVERVVPDGSPELVIHLGDPFQEIDVDGRFQKQSQVLIAGQMGGPLLITPTGVVDLIGVRFKPGGLYPLLGGLDMAELNDRRLDLAAVDRRLWSLVRDVALGRTEAGMISRLERVLISSLRHNGDPAVERSVEMVSRAGGNLPVKDVARAVGVEARRLQRAFRREVGVPLKLLAEVFRFQRIFGLLESGRGAAWATFALDCGYYDQAHLIRDFKRFSGQSPREYFVSRHDLSDHFTGLF